MIISRQIHFIFNKNIQLFSGLQEIPRINNNFQHNLDANKIRDSFANYFMNVGAIECQWEKVLNNEF